MSALSKIDRKSVLLGSLCFALGVGLGVFIEQWLLWSRQVGRFNEILRRLSIIEDEILQMKVRMRKSEEKAAAGIQPTATSETFVTCQRPALSSDEEFADADSDLEDFMSVTSVPTYTRSNVSAQLGSFFNKVDLLQSGTYEEKRQANQLLRDKRIEHSENANFLWRWAKSSHGLYEENGGATSETAKQYLYEAQSFIEKALRIDSANSSVHKWYGVIMGSIGECEGMNQKIRNGYVFKEHIDRALELDENDAEAHHLNGRFCYSVYMLTWVERQLASALFAVPPSATIDDALQSFLRSERLEQNCRIRNQLYIAHCYLQLADRDKAVWWLESAEQIETQDAADRAYLPEVARLLEKHRG